jgi:phosphate acetyltransferase
LRPALQIIKTAPGISVVSGAFLMIIPKKEFGENGIMIFADCAVTPNPTAEQLAEIAYASAKTANALTGMEPRVAMLSFSTKGSASHELVEKVTNATKIAKERYPELIIDGELQADAAIVPKVANSKAPGSPLEGKANVLVFPDLQAANIGYKLVQRMAGAEAIGPVLQGMGKPVNDLSRGCSVEDIVNTVAMTCCQE